MLKSRLALTAFVAAATIGLAACSSDGDTAPGPGDTDIDSTLAAMVWTDGADGLPSLAFETPVVLSNEVARLIEDGDGEAIEPGQVIALDYIMFSGVDGEILVSTYDLGAPEAIEFREDSLATSLWETLQGAHVGARLIFAALDNAAEATDGVQPTIVMAVTVASVASILERAEGTTVTPASGLPQISLADNGAPSVDFTGVEMPSEFVVQPLIAGDGAAVVEGQSITVHYTGWLWDGAQFDSSWDRGESISFTIAQGALIDGWVQGLVGQPVGSQVLLVIPPELAYGDADQGTIPPGSTLVFVVDILAAS